MLAIRPWQCALALLATFTIAPITHADDAAPVPTSPGADTVTRLETRLTAQQAQIEHLRQQLLAAADQNQDAARVEALKAQIRDVLSEQEFRESLMPTVLQAGYDDGFFIRSSDDKFRMNVNGFMQFRWTHYATRSDNRYLRPGLERNDRTGFDLQRLRLILSGHAWSEDLTYYLHMLADAPGNYDFTVLWAWVNYRFFDELQVMLGLLSIPSTRATWLDERGYQFIDRPMTDVVFGLGDGVGVTFWGQLFDKKLDYYLSVTNSLSSPLNRTITNDPAELDGNPAIAFRTVWHALGEDPDGWAFESDIHHSQSPLLDLGFHYAFNDDQGDLNTTNIPFPLPRRFRTGGFGLTTTNGTQINQFGLDAAFKYMGFSATGEYMLRIVDPRRAGRRPFTPWWLVTGQADTTAQHGAYVSLGYFLPIPGLEDKLEAVARVGGISTLANGQEGTWEYGAGLNYYLQGAAAGHQTKLQMDVTKISEVPISNSYSSLANVNDDALVFRVQLQVAF
jgi:phosphate-selective porin OprO/OprP